MNTTIESIKDEVAGKLGYTTWANLVFKFRTKAAAMSDLNFFEIENEVVRLYHARECEEVITQLNNGWDADRKNLSDQLQRAKEEAEKLRARLRNHECLSCGSGNLTGGYLKICKDCEYRQ